ncbi:MAG: hypothetical protein ACR2IK_08965 [Chloroflexota bacterium]
MWPARSSSAFVSAHDLMRTFQISGRNSTLARELGDYVRIGKTLHFSISHTMSSSASLLIQVNKGERCHGCKGKRAWLWRAVDKHSAVRIPGAAAS